MLSQERQSLILDIIKEQGSVTVTRLTEILQSSESTVRRDLSYLASKGKINKVHGGATALGQEFIKLEDNIEEKLTKNTDEKTKIAQYAASQIQDDDFVFIDAAKGQYKTFFEDSYKLLNENGIIFIDNIMFNSKCSIYFICNNRSSSVCGVYSNCKIFFFNFFKYIFKIFSKEIQIFIK